MTSSHRAADHYNTKYVTFSAVQSIVELERFGGGTKKNGINWNVTMQGEKATKNTRNDSRNIMQSSQKTQGQLGLLLLPIHNTRTVKVNV